MNTLDGKKAVVTGGAQGLGEAIVARLAGEGCDVVIGDINGEGAEATAAAVAGTTGRQVLGCEGGRDPGRRGRGALRARAGKRSGGSTWSSPTPPS